MKVGKATYNVRETCKGISGKCLGCGKHPYAEGRFVIALLLDESSSMDSIYAAVVKGYNDFIEEQKKLPTKVEAVVNLFAFDNGFKTIVRNTPISQVPVLTRNEYYPSGSTELY